jgi:hypothetical protein
MRNDEGFDIATDFQVVIMGILDTAGEKMLLGRQKSWPQGVSHFPARFRGEPCPSVIDQWKEVEHCAEARNGRAYADA